MTPKAESPNLAKPSQTVYKCTVGGKVVYTDEPCLGAERLDVAPTRGLNKSTGKELTGADVAQERRREALADALQPITGMDRAQYAIHSRRIHLPSSPKTECKTLDGRITQSEAEERATASGGKLPIQQNLLALRKRHRELGC